jgi:hypothetical protein
MLIGGDEMKTDDQSDILKYEIALADDGSYIRNTVFVDMTNELVEGFLGDIYRISEESGIFKHLADVSRVHSTQSIADMYWLSYEVFQSSPVFKILEIAILTHPDDQSHDFIETLLINIGVMGKIFRNEDDALSWLKK